VRHDFMSHDPLPGFADAPSQTRHDGTIVNYFDENLQLICLTTIGLCTAEQIDEWAIAFVAMVAEMRASVGRVRVLVDRRRSRTASAAMVEQVRIHCADAIRPEDRVAVLVESSLAKVNVKRVLDEQTHMVFVSENAAMTWLTAHD
jgi:hypothetical protein